MCIYIYVYIYIYIYICIHGWGKVDMKTVFARVKLKKDGTEGPAPSPETYFMNPNP